MSFIWHWHWNFSTAWSFSTMLQTDRKRSWKFQSSTSFTFRDLEQQPLVKSEGSNIDCYRNLIRGRWERLIFLVHLIAYSAKSVGFREKLFRYKSLLTSSSFECRQFHVSSCFQDRDMAIFWEVSISSIWPWPFDLRSISIICWMLYTAENGSWKFQISSLDTLEREREQWLSPTLEIPQCKKGLSISRTPIVQNPWVFERNCSDKKVCIRVPLSNAVRFMRLAAIMAEKWRFFENVHVIYLSLTFWPPIHIDHCLDALH